MAIVYYACVYWSGRGARGAIVDVSGAAAEQSALQVREAGGQAIAFEGDAAVDGGPLDDT